MRGQRQDSSLAVSDLKTKAPGVPRQTFTSVLGHGVGWEQRRSKVSLQRMSVEGIFWGLQTLPFFALI